VKIHQEIYGQGTPIVMLHGWAMHTGIWRDFAQQLALDYRVICLDLPGHGLSDAISPYTLDRVANVLIDKIEEPSFYLLGWSLGASIAMAMAKHSPQRLKGLILLAGNPHFVKQNDWAGISPSVLQAFAETLAINYAQTLVRFLALQVNQLVNGKTLLKQIKEAIMTSPTPSKTVLTAGLEILKTADLRDVLIHLDCPLCLVQGNKDTLVPVQVAWMIKTIQPSCELNIIQGAGHVPFLSHPKDLKLAIDHFITD